MTNSRRWIMVLAAAVGLVVLGLLAWQAATTPTQALETAPYLETFDSAGSWNAGEGAYASGEVIGGAYVLSVQEIGDTYWATAGRNFADAEFEVEATPLEGAADNGYGLLFRVDREDGRFYMFKISSDGYVLIGSCSDSCAHVQALVDRDWFASPAVNQGLGATNTLRVAAAGPELTFFVNDQPVGQVTDETLKQGDIGILAETFAPGGLRVAFDNFRVTPLSTE